MYNRLRENNLSVNEWPRISPSRLSGPGPSDPDRWARRWAPSGSWGGGHGPLSVSSAEDWSASTERLRGTETPLCPTALRRLCRTAGWVLSSGLPAGELVLSPGASSPGSWSCAAPGAAGTGGKRSSGRLSRLLLAHPPALGLGAVQHFLHDISAEGPAATRWPRGCCFCAGLWKRTNRSHGVPPPVTSASLANRSATAWVVLSFFAPGADTDAGLGSVFFAILRPDRATTLSLVDPADTPRRHSGVRQRVAASWPQGCGGHADPVTRPAAVHRVKPVLNWANVSSWT